MLKYVLSCHSLGVESVLYIMLLLKKDSTEKQMQFDGTPSIEIGGRSVGSVTKISLAKMPGRRNPWDWF